MAIINLFTYLYDKTIAWSGHPHARYYLAGLSFAESSFFPIPPDVMLISMGLAVPKRSWHYALIATLFSVFGGVFGYILGYFGMYLIAPYLQSTSFHEYYTQIEEWVRHGGLWVVIIAGFSPFPYKIFTISAGALNLPIIPFIIGSIIGRGGRFFLVSGLLYFVGENLGVNLRRYIDRVGWTMLAGLCIFICYLMLCSCGSRSDLAPVVELKWQNNNYSNSGQHIVIKGETLFSIAFRYDQDYRRLAAINNIHYPYLLRIGQILRLQPVQPARQAPKNPSRTTYHQNRFSTATWRWPSNGRIITTFNPGAGKKGINIAGNPGTMIYAASDGSVAYAGNGLPGYGNLIIIKHNNEYLTAYGNNARNLVQEGQQVRAGQTIAAMGQLENHQWGLHFELRKLGRPVNPLNYLPSR